MIGEIDMETNGWGEGGMGDNSTHFISSRVETGTPKTDGLQNGRIDGPRWPAMASWLVSRVD